MTNSKIVFDQQHYETLNSARSESVKHLLPPLIKRLGLRTVIDIGCGVGHFTSLLQEMGLDAVGIDGREKNLVEAKRRYPNLKFQLADAQELDSRSIGSVDLVFCFGLIYHLENPFRLIRSIAAMNPKLALVEGMVYPSSEPVLVLMDEPALDDQALNYLAFYPSESCLAKMLRGAGFAHCYLPSEMPTHENYEIGNTGFRKRSLIIASGTEVASPALEPFPFPVSPFRPWRMFPLKLRKGITTRFREAGRRILKGEAEVADWE